eukprot:SM003317S12456  [mRNA]  locus=s3317:529:925:+ [translate_table: standard]
MAAAGTFGADGDSTAKAAGVLERVGTEAEGGCMVTDACERWWQRRRPRRRYVVASGLWPVLLVALQLLAAAAEVRCAPGWLGGGQGKKHVDMLG